MQNGSVENLTLVLFLFFTPHLQHLLLLAIFLIAHLANLMRVASVVRGVMSELLVQVLHFVVEPLLAA